MKFHERDCKFVARTSIFESMSSPGNAFGANIPLNAERNAASVGVAFGVMNTPERYTTSSGVGAGANVPNTHEDREPIYINRSYHVLSLLFSLSVMF